jgi:hypothetical protein
MAGIAQPSPELEIFYLVISGHSNRFVHAAKTVFRIGLCPILCPIKWLSIDFSNP